MTSELKVDSIKNTAGVDILTIQPSGTVYIPGHVIQVVQAVKTDTYATTPGAVWADISDLSISITPSKATSKILVIVDLKAAGTAGSSVVRSRLLRDSTPIYVGNAAGSRPQVLGQYYGGGASGDIYFMAQIGGTYLDSPSTTSQITYKLQIGGDSTSSTVYVNRTQSNRDTAYYDGQASSSITLMEIAA